jgi:hypothetical protein
MMGDADALSGDAADDKSLRRSHFFCFPLLFVVRARVRSGRKEERGLVTKTELTSI